MRAEEWFEPAGVSHSRALERAGRITDVSATLTLELPEDAAVAPSGTLELGFTLRDVDAPVVVDFAPDHGLPPTLVVNDRAHTPLAVNGHLAIPAAALTPGRNLVTFEFVAGMGGLHRTADLVYSLFVPARASLVFPCFDQPDIKVRWTVVLDVPSAWEATSNARQVERTRLAGHDRVRFAETPPLPTYLLAIVAGRFHVHDGGRLDRGDAASIDGRRLRIFHCEENDVRWSANREALVDRHVEAVDWLKAWTKVDYPFDSFDVVLIPSFQFGGMEHPGAIYYRAESLILDDAATPARYLARDHVIAHETAHIWFGDLVTMRWFDDVWLKEVMANVLAARMLTDWHPEEPHGLRFLVQHYPAAYAVDRTAGANAIRQPLDNLLDAGSLYGPIIYLKAPIAFRDLERQIGAEAFRAAILTFLRRHAFGNADWPDLLACLAQHTTRDLAAWSRAWIETPGRPILRAPAGDTRTRTVSLPGEGLAYGEVVLDREQQDLLSESAPSTPDPVARAAAYIVLWDAMLGHRLPPARLLDTFARALTSEQQPLTRQLLLDYTRELLWRFTPADGRVQAAARMEQVMRTGLGRATHAPERLVWFSALAAIALTDGMVGWLHDVWARRSDADGLVLTEDTDTHLAIELAIRRPEAAADIVYAQHARLTNAERAARLEFIAPAVTGDAHTRAAFAATFADPTRRRREPWVLDAARLLHHPLRETESASLVIPALSLTWEIQRTGDIFFPQRWAEAVLSGYQSSSVADDVRTFIESLPAGYPPRLRNTLRVAADPLFRAARWLAMGG